jgi:predicted GH43/DUF377 family glycosyl hydrolase
MSREITRRKFSSGLGMALAGLPLLPGAGILAEGIPDKEIAPFRTSYKLGKLVLAASTDPDAFDSKFVDDPFVFFHDGAFHMLYTGFDGTGYQTGMAKSTDLLNWSREGCVVPRDPSSKYTRYSVALSSIVREDGLTSRGELKKIQGRYLGAWNAYPNAGYEEGAAVIGLAWSDDLLHWQLSEPILLPQDGAPWEHGGLGRPNLIEEGGTYYLFYSAKTDLLPNGPNGGWREQTGVAVSRDLKKWMRYDANPILHNGETGSWDEHFASDPFVVRDKKQWAIYYSGADARGRARELLALGSDPYHFTKVNEIILDAGAPGSVDETTAQKPCVIFHEGSLYHFYCAGSGKWPHEVRGISVARSSPW